MNVRQRVCAGDESHLASLDLRDAPANLGDVGLRNLRRNPLGEALHQAIGQFNAFGSS